MKWSRKIFTCLILVVALCAAFMLPAFAGGAGDSLPVNGGLTAEIVAGEAEDNAVPVAVVIENTNAYEVKNIEYKLTATDNGSLAGKSEGSGINLPAGDSFTADLSLTAEASHGGASNAEIAALLALIEALVLLLIAFIKNFRQTLSMCLCVLTLSGTAAVAVPAAVKSTGGEAKTSFTVTENVVVENETVKLTLKVTLPGGSGNHLVSFVDSEGNTVKAFSVPDGATVDATEIPILTKDGSSFDGWFLSPEATERFYSDDPVKKDVTAYPGYSELITDDYSTPVYHEAGIVLPEHKVIIVSSSVITADNLADCAVLEERFGVAPVISVTALGDSKYELSGIFPQKGVFCWRLTDEEAVFDGLDASVREYGFTIVGEETEIFEKSDALKDIAAHDFISLDKTADDYVAFLTAFGSSYAVGDRLGITDGEGESAYYRVTAVISSTNEPDSGRTLWKLQVTPCAIEEVYDEIDINLQNEEADEIIDLSNPEDTLRFMQQIKNSEEIRVYADYIASAVNDSVTYQQMARDASGDTMYIDFTSDTMRAAAANAKAGGNATANALDETFKLVGGIDISKPGVSVDINVSPPTVKLDDFNSYWDKRYAEVGEKDPKTGEIVNKGKENYFGKRFASIETEVGIGFTVNGGNKSVKVEATLRLKQYVKLCCGISGKLEIGTEMYKNLQLNAGGTAYTETNVDMAVKLLTSNGTFDISEEVEDIVSAAEGEKYESDNQYIRRFRSLYDGSDNDFIEVYRKDICAFRLAAGPVEVDVPIAFVIRFGLSAGVGIGYDYRTTYSVGVYKERNSKVITPYYSSGVPSWDFNFYVAGHVGVKLGIEAEFGISITGCSKIFKIGVEAEFGIRADFYGYFLLSHNKDWKSYKPVTDVHGAYYFATKFYLNIKLFAKAFTYEKKWELFSYEKIIYSAGDRYVLLDFKARGTTPQTVIIPVTADTPLTRVKDGAYTYDTVCVDLSKYYNSLGASFFDLQKANEVFNKSAANELLSKYVTFSTAGIMRLRDGANYADSSNLTAHLSPSVLNSLLSNESTELDTTVTFVYNGPLFSVGGDKPSVTYKFKFVSQSYLTGRRYNVNYWVDGNLYQNKQYVEGTSIPFWDASVSKEYCKSLGIGSAVFQLPAGPIAQDMDLYAKCFYSPNNVLALREKHLTNNGLGSLSNVHQGISKGAEVDGIEHGAGLLQPYFLGWDLEGDGSDELNVPIPGQNTTYTYNAVYSELPEYKVTVIDGTTGMVISQTSVTLGESYSPERDAPPDDGRIYESTLTCKSGSFLGNFPSLEPSVIMYPTSDITLVWTHEVRRYEVSFYIKNNILFDEQTVTCGELAVDPVSADPSQLDYYDAQGGYYKFLYWEVWNGESFVDASVTPITEHSNIYAKYRYMGIYYDIELLDEDGETSLYSGKVKSGERLNSLYYRTKLSDTEKTYELCWCSAADGSVGTTVTKAGTYILTWAATAREYTVELDAEAQTLSQGAVTFEDVASYAELRTYIENQIGAFVPAKPETDYVTYTYDGFTLYCDANSGGEYGRCTVSFLFVPVPKQCTVTYDVTDLSGNTGTLWYGQNEVMLTDGAYSFPFTLSEANSSLEISYQANPANPYQNFVGWSFGGVTYTSGETLSLVGHSSVKLIAVYERKPLTVTLEPDGGVFTGDTVIYANQGESIALPTPVKAADAQYSYRFLGWKDTSGSSHTGTYPVSASAALTAVYEKTLRSYSITFNAGGGVFTGNKAQVSINCDYGTVPAPELPEKASTATEKYTFAGWTPAVVSVTGEAEYTATWTVTKLYTITFNAGNGRFSSDKSVMSYTVEDGEVFNISGVPTPYYSYNGEVRGFTGWSPAGTSVTVNENAEYTAVWSEPKTAVGIMVTDGVNTEDIAVALTGEQSVSGYSYEYITDIEGVEPFFKLRITTSGLALSGDGAVDYIELSDASVTFKELTAAASIQVYEVCEITIDGAVTLNATVELSETAGAPEGAPEGKLTFTGADSEARLIVNSNGSAIRSYNGDIEMIELNAEITANETVPAEGEAAVRSTAIGSNDASFNISFTGCTLHVHKGLLSGALTFTNSTVTFDDNDYNGIFSYYFDIANPPAQPAAIVSLVNSELLFLGKAYIDIIYSAYNGNPPAYYHFFKQDGTGASGEPISGSFLTSAELQNTLNSSEGAWMLTVDADSAIRIGESA